MAGDDDDDYDDDDYDEDYDEDSDERDEGPTREGQCQDKEKRRCASWKKSNYCRRTSQEYRHMMINCKKTCGFCVEGGLEGNVDHNELHEF